MLTLALALIGQDISPAAERQFTEYATMQMIVGMCSEYIDARDFHRIQAEADAMPTAVATMLRDMRTQGLLEKASYKACVKAMPATLRKAKARLDYGLSEPKRDTSVEDFVNARFAK